MDIQTLANAALIIAAVAFIGFRQIAWRPVIISQMWRQPIIMGIIGVFILSQAKGTLRTIDITVLVIEFVVALGVGAAMGRIARFRPLTTAGKAAVDVKSGGKHQADFESSTGWIGFALWAVFIAVRIGIDVVAGMNDATIATSTGVILVMLGANRLARTFVFLARVDRYEAVTV
ncbi:hypothetical protein BH09ACT1_BH09ACT1_20290 [soil metagenome]